MPFKSKAQAAWMFVHHPLIAKKWAKVTNFKRLPKRKKR
jgi:hypothetical protein